MASGSGGGTVLAVLGGIAVAIVVVLAVGGIGVLMALFAVVFILARLLSMQK